MSDNRVAVIITNYNMYERADALFEYIADNSEWPCDMIMVDNGSQPQYPSKWTTVKLQKNIQITGGWLVGLCYAKFMAELEDRKHLAYWFLTTSAEFVKASGDPPTPLAEFFLEHEGAVAIHAALTKDSTTAHESMVARGGPRPRRVTTIDNIAPLWRADWYDEIGGFNPKLVYAWGIPAEICWKARKQGRGIWIHEGTTIKKVKNIGYKMNRMGMSAERRSKLAVDKYKKVLGAMYGPDFAKKFADEYTQHNWR